MQDGGSALLFACDVGERAFEDPARQQSVFTACLVEALSGRAAPVGSLTVADVAEYVQRQVRAWAREHGKRQNPQMETFGPAKIVLGTVSAPAPVVEGGAVERLSTKATLLVTSTPSGAAIFLNGQDSGQKTPATLQVPVGEQPEKLAVSLKLDGYEEAPFRVTLERGKQTKLDGGALEKRAVRIPSPPTGGGQAGQTKINPKDGAEMIFIPAGAFQMGEEDLSTAIGAHPRRTVNLPGYWIYKNLVTVAQYKKFCQATGRQMPEAPRWGLKDDHPVVNVTAADAEAYCRWAGVRLPSEEEWEKAARGTDGRKYPWGNEWDPSKCANSVGATLSSTMAAGSFPQGASPYGVLDMAGNVGQLTSSSYDARYRVVCGSSWSDVIPDIFRVACRGLDLPNSRGNGSGFRGAAGP